MATGDKTVIGGSSWKEIVFENPMEEYLQWAIRLTDIATNTIYGLQVNNGTLELVEV